MNRPSTHVPNAFGLTRRTTGLTDAHKQLIKLLAEIAVADFLAEREPSDEIVEDREETAR